jgi:hypothetical protein
MGVEYKGINQREVCLNKELAGEIFQALYWCKALNVAKSKWRIRIAEKFRRNGVLHKYTTDDFCKTWDELKKQNLI